MTQRRAIDVFHGDKRTLGVLAHLVDLADERVIESRCGLGFIQQSLSGAGISDLGGGEELQCQSAVEGGVMRKKHLAHAAFADAGEDPVPGDQSADHRLGQKGRPPC